MNTHNPDDIQVTFHFKKPKKEQVVKPKKQLALNSYIIQNYPLKGLLKCIDWLHLTPFGHYLFQTYPYEVIRLAVKEILYVYYDSYFERDRVEALQLFSLLCRKYLLLTGLPRYPIKGLPDIIRLYNLKGDDLWTKSVYNPTAFPIKPKKYIPQPKICMAIVDECMGCMDASCDNPPDEDIYNHLHMY